MLFLNGGCADSPASPCSPPRCCPPAPPGAGARRARGGPSTAMRLRRAPPAPMCSMSAQQYRPVPGAPPRRASWRPTRSCSPSARRSRASVADATLPDMLGATAAATPDTASSAATSTCAAAATPPSAPRRSQRYYGGGATGPGARTAARRTRGIDAGHGPGLRRRVALRLACAAVRTRATAVSTWVGPLSALSYNRGLATRGRQRFQRNPPAVRRRAARRRARGARHSAVTGKPAPARAPDAWTSGQRRLAADGPARHDQLMNKPSDNFFAEMLLKDLAHRRRTAAAPRRRARRWSTAFRPPARRRRAARRRLGSGARQPRLALPRGQAAARDAQRAHERPTPTSTRSPSPGSDGTLVDRMRRGPRRDRCRGKTGTLSDVSALSGYCEVARGRPDRVLAS